MGSVVNNQLTTKAFNLLFLFIFYCYPDGLLPYSILLELAQAKSDVCHGHTNTKYLLKLGQIGYPATVYLN